MDMITLLAASDSAHAPGWGKLTALLLTGGSFLLVMKVWERVKAAKSGAKVNPFSREADFGTLDEKSQVTPPADTPEEAPEEGSGKGSRWGWRRKK